MKKLFLLLISFMCLNGIIAAPLKSKVDERFELTSIVFRLAGAKEYSQCAIPSYAKAIDSTFAQYKDHKLITHLQNIRKEYGVSYGDGAFVAACLEIKKGKVVLKRGLDILKISEIDSRWTLESFRVFLDYLNDFYKESEFHDFFLKNTDLYRLTESRLDERLAMIDISWFKSTFGEKLKDPIIIASLTNWPSNYAFIIPDKSRQFGIVIGAGRDAAGQPAYLSGSVSVILHEFSHKYANPLMDRNWPQIEASAQKIYPHVREAMARIAYGDARSTMTEWFVNLMVCLYFVEHPQIQKQLNVPVEALVIRDQSRGFIWMGRSVKSMQQFIDNRDKYPTMDSYMPEVVKFVNHTAEDFDQVLDEIKQLVPYIVETSPANGSTISADTDSIVVRFSVPMFGDAGVGPLTDKSILALPIEKRMWKDMQTFVLVLKKGELQKGKTYGAWFGFFRSQKGYVMDGMVAHTFKIAE